MKQVIAFSLDERVIDKIKQEAAENHWSVSFVANRILAEHFGLGDDKRKGGKK